MLSPRLKVISICRRNLVFCTWLRSENLRQLIKGKDKLDKFIVNVTTTLLSAIFVIFGVLRFLKAVASILARRAIAPNKKITGLECLFAPSMF